SAVALAVFGAVVIAVAVLVERRPSGFLPEDDQGYLLMVAQLPPGASFQRTEAVLEEMRQIVMRQPEAQTMLAITGLNLLAGVPQRSRPRAGAPLRRHAVPPPCAADRVRHRS